jgi:hypothetical protein
MKWRWTTKGRRTGGLSLIALAILAISVLQPKDAPVVAKKLVPARDTTFLLEPAREDGTIDYARALAKLANEDAEGAAPESDAAPLLARAVEAARVRVDDGALDLAVAAAERPRFVVAHDGPLCARPLRPVESSVLVEGLCARARARAAAGDRGAATKDLGAARRIARRVARPATLEERAAMEASARRAWQEFGTLARGSPGADRGPWIEDLARLASEETREPFEEALREGVADTRIEALDRLSAIYRGAAAESAAIARARETAAAAKSFGGLDPNRVFRRFNAQWDRVEAVLLDAATPWPERASKLAQLRDEIERSARDGPPKPKERPLPWLSTPDEKADQLADQVVSLLADSSAKSLATWMADVAAVDRSIAEVAAFAFAAATGRDPATTEELAPTVFAVAFRDRIASASLSFSRAADGSLAASGPAGAIVEAVRTALEPR